jgi:polyhydroxybutyrate depolymerase
MALLGVFMRHGTVQSTMGTVRYWASVAGHRGEPQRQPPCEWRPSDETAATRLLWSDGERPDVALVVIEGGGHTIPHRDASSPRLLGRTCHDFDAAEEIWSFFDRSG